MINYLKDIFNKESDASSKRFFGSIIIISAIIMIAIWRHDLIDELLYTGVGLLVGTLFERSRK